MTQSDGIWFIYDGACPLCSTAALATRIKQRFGQLHLIDARTQAAHPLVQEITQRGYDLDEGMVIYHNGQIYHGQSALSFMAQHGEAHTGFMALCKSLFWSDYLARLFYPWLRGIRNWLIRRKHVRPLDNLGCAAQPIFAPIFGADWPHLPPVFHKHYANRPYTHDVVTVNGHLDVYCARPLRLMGWALRLTGGFPPYTESQVPVTVHFRSDPHTKRYHFERIFNFKGRRPYHFHSYMEQTQASEVVEITRNRLGWHAQYGWNNGNVVLQHKAFVLRVLGYTIRLPLEILLGQVIATETATSDSAFDMSMEIRHPRWGLVYSYKGHFEVQDTP